MAKHDGRTPRAARVPEFRGQTGGEGEYAHYLGLMMREGRKFQVTIAALELIAGLGLIFHSDIPYTPVFPTLVLLASLVCLVMALRARELARILHEDAWHAAVFVFSSFGGGITALMFSVAGTLTTALGPAYAIAPGGDRLILLNLSWPAVLIAATAIAIDAVLMRQIDWSSARRR